MKWSLFIPICLEHNLQHKTRPITVSCAGPIHLFHAHFTKNHQDIPDWSGLLLCSTNMLILPQAVTLCFIMHYYPLETVWTITARIRISLTYCPIRAESNMNRAASPQNKVCDLDDFTFPSISPDTVSMPMDCDSWEQRGELCYLCSQRAWYPHLHWLIKAARSRLAYVIWLEVLIL